MAATGATTAMARRPLKQHGAENAHGASAEGGWVQLSVSVLLSDGLPPASSSLRRSLTTAPHGASAEAGLVDKKLTFRDVLTAVWELLLPMALVARVRLQQLSRIEVRESF